MDAGATGPFGLKVGPKPDFVPRLIVSDETVRDMAEHFAAPDTLIVTDAYNYPKLQDLGKCVAVHDGTPEQVRSIAEMPGFDTFHRVVGIGGCLALDIAKAVAVGMSGSPLVAIPTILSTNCLTKNRSVIGEGLDARSYRTTAPRQVLVSLTDLMHQDPQVRVRWSQAGWGDFFAKISAMVDQLSAGGKAVTSEGLSRIDREVMDGLDWVNSNFHGYDRTSMRELAHHVHNAGVKVIAADTNDTSVGGEHRFYKALMELYPDLRSGPPHGTIVAIGTLVTTAALARQTGDPDLYGKVRSAFEKLGLPTTYQGLSRLGLSREALSRSLQRIAQSDVPESYLGSYFRTHDDSILDDIFGR